MIISVKNPLRPLHHFLFLMIMIIGGLSFSACNMPVQKSFRQEATIKNAQWFAAFQPTFTVAVKDTTANYQSYILLRNDDSYPFSNIWLKIMVKAPGDTAFIAKERISLKLADISGAWLGRGMGAIWEHKIPLSQKYNLHFSKTGKYQIKLVQIMREEPLPGILNIGIQIEKQ